MTRSIKTASSLAALATAFALASGAAFAQTPAPTTAPAASTSAAPTDAPPVVDLYTDDDAQAALDARLIALKTVIRLTPEQEKLWQPVEAAIRKASADAVERAKSRATAEPATHFLTVLERLADAEIARAQDLKTVVEAAKPLVAALSPEQQRRLPAFLGMTDIAGRPQPTAELWIFEAEQE
jgi:hypothetical protein